MKICPNCKNSVEDDIKLCPNCNTFIADAQIMSQQEINKVENDIKKNNDNIDGEYVSKPVKNSVYSIISFVFSVICIIGAVKIPFTFKLSVVFLLFTGNFFSTFLVSNIIFIACGVLALFFGSIHKKRYNYRCTGYILGFISLGAYVIAFLYFAYLYLTASRGHR